MTTPPQPNRIYRLALPVPLYRLFDYLIDDSTPLAQPGARIEVPFGKTVHVGVLIEIATESEVKLDKLKPILRVLDYPPLLAKIDLDLLHWVSRYYHHPLGEVMNLAFPKLLRSPALSTDYAEPHYQLTEVGFNLELSSLKRSRKQHAVIAFLQQHRHAVNVATLTCQTQATPALIKQLCAKEWLARVAPVEAQPLLSPQLLKSPILSANAEQQAAITAVSEQLGKFSVFLLEGVTGSGKTEVYMQIIQQALTQGLQVLVLVPEISLTPQLEQRFRQRFNVAIAVSHSKLTDKQRGLAWLSIQQGHSQILLGTRSALFTPLKWPGLIILDEEHDVSFKQQDGLRFSARDVAVMRAKLLNIPVVLGSATPSLESLHNAINRRYQHLHLPQRAGLAITPEMVLLDIRNKKSRTRFIATLMRRN
ncbi:replication restart helicase PriA [Methylocucumis oryzae]|uniref:replication restart helicase PriA n=1 Tax=Methylocucumis oryzae TaxID=1632867 RepID=UPI000B1F8AE0|nr:primosomal protein N' [Methylocucumis oryzae]